MKMRAVLSEGKKEEWREWKKRDIKKPIPAGQASIGVCNRFLCIRVYRMYGYIARVNAYIYCVRPCEQCCFVSIHLHALLYPYFTRMVLLVLVHEHHVTSIISRVSSAGFA